MGWRVLPYGERGGVQLYSIVIIIFRVHQTNTLKKDWENGMTLLPITRGLLSVNIQVRVIFDFF